MNPDIDEKNLEITFSAASAEPYFRSTFDGNYFEVLTITPEAIDMSRLNDGASILRNHETDHVVGVVQKAWIEEGKLMIRARFRANDPDSVAIFKDAADGTLRNVSIGYVVSEYRDRREGDAVYRDVTRWQVLEVSVAVGVPADPTVGFYRSFEQKGNAKMAKREIAQPEADDPKLKVDTEAEDTPAEEAAPAAPEEEKGECTKECGECDKEGCADREAAPAEDQTPAPSEEDAPEEKEDCEVCDEQKKRALYESLKREFEPVKETKIKSLNIITKGTTQMSKEYSLCRAFQSLLRSDVDASFERSVSDELYTRSGLAPSRSGLMLRTNFDGTTGAGMIGTDHRGDMFVEALRTRMGVKGATVLSGLVGNVDIPAQTGISTVGIGLIGGTAGVTNPTSQSITLSPKKLAAYTVVGEDLIAQGNPDAISFVMRDLQAQLARALDKCILKGNANPQVKGVDGTSGVQTVAVSSLDALTWAKALEFGGKIADYEIDPAGVSWVTKGSSLQAFKGISKDAGSGRFLVEENKMDGYDVNVCGALDAGDLYLGVWKNIIIGQWGGLEVKIDDVTGLKEGSVTIVAKLLFDIAVTNPASFVKRIQPGS